MPVVVKVSYQNDLRRITLSSSEKSMLQVVINKTAATSGVSADALSFSYVDDEGDVIRVLTEQGLQEAMRVCEGKTLKLKAEVAINNDDKPAAPANAPAPAPAPAAAAWRKQVVAEASSSDAAAGQPLDRLAAVEKFVSSVAQAPIALAVQDNVNNKDSDEKEEKEESPDDSPPSAQFVRDVTVPDGQKRVCNTTVVKTWALQNNGASVWPRGCTLLYSKGMVAPCEGNDHASPVPEALPNEVVNVSVEVRVPELPGRHHGEYTLVGPDGRTPFLKHHKIWVDVRAYESKPLAEVAKEAAKDAAKEVQRMFESIKKGAVLPPLTSSPSQEKQEKQEKQPQHDDEAPLQMSPLSLQEDEDDEEVVAAPAPFEVEVEEEEEQKRDDDDEDDEVVKPSSITAAEPEALSSLSSAKKEMESQCAALLATVAGMVDEETDLQRIQAATELVQRATASLLLKKAEPAEEDNGDNVDVDQVSPKQASCDEEGDGSLNDEDLNKNEKNEKEAGKGKSWVQSLLPSFMTRQAVAPKEEEEEQEASAEAVPAPEEPQEEKRDDDDDDKEEEQVVVVEKKQPQPPSQPKPKPEEALRARFTRDVTIPDGTSLPVGDAAIKTWEFRNEGSQRWPAGTTLMHVGGGLAPQSGQKQVVLSEAQLAAPGELSQLSVPIAASGEGRQVGFYQLAIPNGTRFGTRVWVDITGVEPSVEDQVVEEKAAQVADEQPAEKEEKPQEEEQPEAQVDASNDSGSESEDAAMGWEVVAAPVESQDEEDNDDAEEEAVAVEEVEVVEVEEEEEDEEQQQQEQEQMVEAEQPQVPEPEPVVAQPEPVAAEAPQDEAPVRAEPAAAQPAAQPADDMQHKLSQLSAMGFQDNELNTDLLRDAKGDLQRVINWLVNQA